MAKNNETSWGGVADWYDELLGEGKETYQSEVVLPNILRLLDLKKDEVVLDVACGQGYFSRHFFETGARVTGVDISPELIAKAKKKSPIELTYKISSADKLPFIQDNSTDKLTIILAIQNIENIAGVMKECRRVLKDNGKIVIVMNHPAFRIPKESDWGFDEETSTQYRKVNRYLSELKIPIQMHPGSAPDDETLSFHRPLQYYFKAFSKNGFCVSRLEEWTSHKKSVGKRAVAENKARKEIPIFMALELVKK